MHGHYCVLRSKKKHNTKMSQVLIVDDSRTNLALLSHLTQRADSKIAVESCDHAAKALHWLSTNKTDLIIVDYNMPDINGIAFTRRCRSMPNGKDVPIVMVTSARRRQVCLEALSAGATEFLNSPVNEDDFLSRVGHLLRTYRKSHDLQEHALELQQTRNMSRQRGLPQSSPEWLKLAYILDNVPVMVSAISPTGQCLFVNAMQAAFFGCEADDLTGKYLSELPEQIRDHIGKSCQERTAPSNHCGREFEQIVIDKEGTPLVLLTTKREIFNDAGTTIAYLTTSVDITARTRAEENLRHVAEHDSLTELPNRLSLRHHMARLISNEDGKTTRFALLFIDVDRFKDINDTLGHDLGDRLLSELAGRLDKTIAAPNFIARLGGDEFAVVVPESDEPSSGTIVAQAICDRLREPFLLANHEIRMCASTGIAHYPDDGTTVDELLSRADRAMYRAKANGGNGYRVSCLKDHARACRNASLQSDLRTALNRDQLKLYYQPKVRLSDRKVIGAEALIRWQHPDKGIVSPADFLPLAEENGLILPIGEWVIHKACQDAGAWHQLGHKEHCVSVNISATQFAKQKISQIVKSALHESPLTADKLVVELTEQSILRNTDTLRGELSVLREMGTKLSLDDFGTGYASLRYVQNFPITELKIDRSFVKNHTVDGNDSAIVKAIISLGQSLNLDIVAEGVECLADALSLENAGCHFAQGYYFSPPVPLHEFHKILSSGQALGQTQEDQCA